MMTASSSSSFLSDSRVVMPLIPGIITSTMAASKGTLRASSMPSSPLAASLTEYPSPFNRVSRISRMISSSSTTRIEPFFCISSPLIPDRARSRLNVRDGQRYCEAGSLTDGALTREHAVVLADDAVGNRQTETGAFSNQFRREERVVDARQVLARYPRTGIPDFSRNLTVLQPRRHRQPAALRHRVASIQEEIQKY